ncbi:tetratricopeptide repeat protein [Desulfolutivibrio sulfoxidireducens]|uniref:tetratricopeptide repeat protein n=1 Tax=Desulfolutivibrio sulfoxidireducens TaxID=2773299 RepID=UPI00159E1950|nr:tetratricopeptide repeat protein [Desulfolutivibrio sulfoxidireducens]QLA19197.1 tetratricopeptide repeat protein [Desulfolutivibrio sulfoxidireducens]
MTTTPDTSLRDPDGRAALAGKYAAALMGLALAAIFLGSFLYRVENPSQVVRADVPAMPQGMADGGPMKEIMELMQRQKAEPDNPAVQLELAERFMMMGAFDRALIFLEKAEQLDPKNPQVLNDKGIALHNVGRSEEAKSAFEAILVANPDDYRARFNLGLLYKYALGDMAKAAEQLKAVMDSPAADERTKKQAGEELASPPESGEKPGQ